MSYQNFIPTVWNEGIERELEKLCVFVEDCNRKYEGKVKKQGESVTILGVGRPTIKKIAKSARNNKIDEAETVEDTSVIMYINEFRYFNYEVGDIDKAQAQEGIMEALSAETTEGLADEIDKHIASMVVDSSVAKLSSAAVKVLDHRPTGSETGKYVLDIIDEAIQKLYENNVKQTTKVVVTISPRFYTLFKRAYVQLDTDNSAMLKNGKVGMYGNVVVKMSNNVHRTESGATDNIMIRTQRAVAYARPFTHSEPYRPELKFADAVKGYTLFDAKVVRPKEILNINVKYA